MQIAARIAIMEGRMWTARFHSFRASTYRKIALKMHANVLAIRRKALSQVWVCLGRCGFPNETGGGEVPGWPSHMLGRGEIEDPWRKGLMGLRPLSVRTYDTPDSLAFRLYKSESAHGE
jgi:hypothetical protein